MKEITRIRRMIATMANRLKKMGLTLSAAFKKAWELVKGHTIETKIAGVTKGSRQKALHHIAVRYRPEDVAVTLVRDTANLYDNHAVMVDISVKGSETYTMGFIPRNLAYVVSAILDKGIKLTATFKEVRGRYKPYMNYGAVIALKLA